MLHLHILFSQSPDTTLWLQEQVFGTTIILIIQIMSLAWKQVGGGGGKGVIVI